MGTVLPIHRRHDRIPERLMSMEDFFAELSDMKRLIKANTEAILRLTSQGSTQAETTKTSAASGSVSTTLADLADTTIGTLADLDILGYDNGNSDWRPKTWLELGLLDEDDFASDSPTLPATQQSIKAFLITTYIPLSTFGTISNTPDINQHLLITSNVQFATVDIVHIATEPDDHALEIDVDAAGFGDVKAIAIAYITGIIAAGEDVAINLVNIDEIQATGGEIFAHEVLATEGSAAIYALKVGILVNVIKQQSGIFENADGVDDNGGDTNALDTGGAGNVAVFTNLNEYMIFRHAAKFEELELIVDTGASGAGIKPTFEYSTGAGPAWTPFTPVDGTNAVRNTGIIDWDDDDLAGWVQVGGEYQIRIKRTRSSLSVSPILDKVQISSVILFSWNKTGDLIINDLSSSGTISVDTIAEKTGATGVTLDSVLLKDGLVDGIDVAARDHAATVAGDLNHNDLANIDAGDINHLTDAQISALHNIATFGDVDTGTDFNSHAEQTKAAFNLNGGGSITVDGSYRFGWGTRFLIMNAGSGSHFSTSGYFFIGQPTSGTITAVGGGTANVWNASGIVIPDWQTLYYILPIGSDFNSVPANFRMVGYTSALEIPDHWVVIAQKNGDGGDRHIKVTNGLILNAGETWNMETSSMINTDTVFSPAGVDAHTDLTITGAQIEELLVFDSKILMSTAPKVFV